MGDIPPDGSQPRITLYTDSNGWWLKRVWAEQCPQTIMLGDRCQGVAGHEGDHWRFKPDGSYYYKPHESDERHGDIGCGITPPGHAEYRTPVEMSRFYYVGHYEDSEVTDPDELARLERGDFADNESVDRPYWDDDL